MAMIVTVGNTKGGVGKSTIALQIALGRAKAGKDVWLVDGDRQGTSQTAVAIRAEAGREPGLSCAQYVDGATLRAQVLRQAKKFDDVIIDAGGRDSTSLRAALMLSDMLLVPVQPRSVDVWALEDVEALVKEAQSLRDGLRANSFLNCADPGISADNTEAMTALSEYKLIPPFPLSVRRRKAIANATGQGLAVAELRPSDPKAEEEINSLISMVF